MSWGRRFKNLYVERASTGLTVAGIDSDFKMREQVEAYGVPGTPTLAMVGQDGRVAMARNSLSVAARHAK